MNGTRDYDDIPGTYVYDSRLARLGYSVNAFCKSLDVAENRDLFRADEEDYLKGFGLTADQTDAVLNRDWLRLLHLGGNMYFIFKLAILDGRSMQYVGGEMSGMTEAEFRSMMLAGGRRSVENG